MDPEKKTGGGERVGGLVYRGETVTGEEIYWKRSNQTRQIGLYTAAKILLESSLIG